MNRDTRTIIDIGGQDSKAIQVDPDNGNVTEFIMNDKCAAEIGSSITKTRLDSTFAGAFGAAIAAFQENGKLQYVQTQG